jgi:hypothetical protein
MKRLLGYACASTLLVLLVSGCPATLYVHVLNASGAPVAISDGARTASVALGESVRLRAWPGAGPSQWVVTRSGVSFRYDRAFSAPDEFIEVGVFSTSMRVTLDEHGRFWLLAPDSSDDTPIHPQPAGFPFAPSEEPPGT